VLVRTFCTAEDHIVFAEPSFVVYRMVALVHGVPFTAVPLGVIVAVLASAWRSRPGDVTGPTYRQ
jgi:histidinol-phosphate/aromatic aminotransferase/cobyric acid decarboxylase-like protein